MPYTPPCSSPPQNQSAAGVVRPSPTVLGHGRHHSDPSVSVSTQRPKLHLSSSYLRRHRRSPTLSRRSSSEDGDGPENVKQNGQSSVNSNFWQIPHSGNTSTRTSTVPSPPDSRNNSSDEAENNRNMYGAAMNSVTDQKRSRTRSDQGRNVDALSSRLGLLNLGQNAHGRALNKLSKTSDALLLSGAADIAVQTPDQSDQEDDLRKKPPMIRKKSGELVRPALRCSTRHKSKSLPGTPTFSKAVHFGAQLEEVRHFLQLDRPLAVSANSSPAESYDSDSEFPFGLSEPPGRNKNFTWEARIANFSSNLDARRSMPVRLDRIFLSADNKYLVGVVVVANLAYHKHVVARFTLDYWKTVSEVTAEYNNDIQLKEQAKAGYDTFNFNISLADHSNLDEKRMFMCVRYNVDGLEFWDNNNSMNYHIDFKRKYKPKDEKSESIHKKTSLTSSVPAEFVTGRPVKLSTRADDIIPESPTRRPTNAFGNRYNFTTSLTAAAPSFKRSDSIFSNGNPFGEVKDQVDGASQESSVDSSPDSRHSIPRSDLISDKLQHQSPIYKELVDKYCFFGSDKQGDTQKKNGVARGSSGAVEDKIPDGRESAECDLIQSTDTITESPRN